MISNYIAGWQVPIPPTPPLAPSPFFISFRNPSIIRPYRFAYITYVPAILSESLAHATTGLAT